MTGDCTIVRADVRLARVPVDPPRGDAIQEFDALELPIVEIVNVAGRRGVGFAYTIGTGGTAITTLIADDLLPTGCRRGRASDRRADGPSARAHPGADARLPQLERARRDRYRTLGSRGTPCAYAAASAAR